MAGEAVRRRCRSNAVADGENFALTLAGLEDRERVLGADEFDGELQLRRTLCRCEGGGEAKFSFAREAVTNSVGECSVPGFASVDRCHGMPLHVGLHRVFHCKDRPSVTISGYQW